MARRWAPLADALSSARADFCLGCVTGEYSYDVDGEATDRDVERPVVGSDATPADD